MKIQTQLNKNKYDTKQNRNKNKELKIDNHKKKRQRILCTLVRFLKIILIDRIETRGIDTNLCQINVKCYVKPVY